jgi:hypothetical protein
VVFDPGEPEDGYPRCAVQRIEIADWYGGPRVVDDTIRQLPGLVRDGTARGERSLRELEVAVRQWLDERRGEKMLRMAGA